MSSRKQVFAIFDNADKRQETLPFEERILTYLDSHNATALVEPEDFNDADFVISMGGKGRKPPNSHLRYQHGTTRFPCRCVAK